MAASMAQVAAHQALAAGRAHHGGQMMGYPVVQGQEDAGQFRYAGEAPGQMGPSMHSRDIYAMQQHIAANPSAPPHLQSVPAQAQPNGVPNGVYQMGLAEQAMRQQQAAAQGRVPGQPMYSNAPGHPTFQHMAAATLEQQRYAAAAAAQAQANAAMQSQPQSAPSPSPNQGYSAQQQQPTPGPSRMAMRPGPPSRQGSVAQMPANAMQALTPAQQQQQAVARAQAEAQAHALAQQSNMQAQQQQQQNQQRMMAAAAAARPMPSMQPSYSGIAMMRLLQYSDLVSAAMQMSTYEALQDFVADYFTEDALILYSLYDPESDTFKTFEIPACAVPRYLSTLQESGVRGMYLCYDSPKEYAIFNGPTQTGFQVDCQRLTYMTHFSNGTQTTSKGSQRARFVKVPRPIQPGMPAEDAAQPPLLKLASVEYLFNNHSQAVMRDSILLEDDRARPTRSISGSFSTGEVPSPTLTSAGSAGSATSDRPGKGSVPSSAKRRRTNPTSPVKSEPNGDLGDLHSDGFEESKPGTSSSTASFKAGSTVRSLLPPPLTNNLGITDSTMRCLELAEQIAVLQPLMAFSKEHECSGPLEAFARYIEDVASRNEAARRFLSGEDFANGAGSPMQVPSTPVPMPVSTPQPPSSIHNASPKSPAVGTRRKATSGAGDAKSPTGDDDLKTSPTSAGRPRNRTFRG